MPERPGLTLRFADVHDQLIGEPVDLTVRHTTSGKTLVARAPASRRVTVRNVVSGVYHVRIDPPSYLPSAVFAMVAGNGEGDTTVRLAVDAVKVKRARFPRFADLLPDARRLLDASAALLGFQGTTSGALYDAFDDVRRAGLLNVLAKSADTILTNGRTVVSYLTEVTELRGDRVFAVVPHELREETKNSARAGLFDEAPSGLHHPPAGFTSAGSFKTPDHYGNLQLTFFSNGPDWVADIDVDDAGGLAHVFQVARNALTGRPTHPYDIHQILIGHQGLDPGYGLEV